MAPSTTSARAFTSAGLSTAIRTRSAPAAVSSSSCLRVAGTSWVRVAAMDCTMIGASPPMVREPMRIERVLRGLLMADRIVGRAAGAHQPAGPGNRPGA